MKQVLLTIKHVKVRVSERETLPYAAVPPSDNHIHIHACSRRKGKRTGQNPSSPSNPDGFSCRGRLVKEFPLRISPGGERLVRGLTLFFFEDFAGQLFDHTDHGRIVQFAHSQRLHGVE